LGYRITAATATPHTVIVATPVSLVPADPRGYPPRREFRGRATSGANPTRDDV